MAILAYRSLALWCLAIQRRRCGHERLFKDAREIGQAATLILALTYTSIVDILRCANYAAASQPAMNLSLWRTKRAPSSGRRAERFIEVTFLRSTGKAAEAVQMITSSMAALRATGATLFMPLYLSHLARAYAELGQFDDAWRCIGEAMTADQNNQGKMVGG